MEFSRSSRSLQLGEELGAFVADRVVPAEPAWTAERTEAPDTPSPTADRLAGEAKELGLWNLCVRNPDYGPALSFVDYAPLAEALGPHRLAQEATNCDAPSNINADAMLLHGTPAQIERWVEPQLDGQIKSAFAMTEPAVASSDASNIATSAVADGDHWIINGRKWYISGVLHPRCGYLMTVANTDPDAPRHGRHTQFIVPIETPGLTIERNLPKFGYLDDDGHCEISFHNVRVPNDAVLGQLGGGFGIGQARLGPARVQHCMRIIGITEEALRLMCERAPTRSTFGAAVSTR